MAQFTLDIDSSDVAMNPNATGLQASYRQKSLGGSFITTGFTPDNPLPVDATSCDSPSGLLDNVIYQFQIQTLCTQNGPTTNSNGIQEIISFACITPTITETDTQSQITIDLTGLDITKARFTLRKSSDNTVVMSGTIVNKVSNAVTITKTGLVASTSYYWQVEFYATVNNVEVISSSLDYTGSACSPYPFTTSAPPICDPITAVTVTAVNS